MEMQAELSPPHAPDLTMRMAGMARRLPELEEDPVAFYARAQELFETRGDLDNAQLAADERLAVMLDRAYAADAVAAAYLEFARISEALGDLDLADRVRDLADAGQVPTSEGGTQKSGTRGEGDAAFRTVDVYYATDRSPTGETDPARVYGAGRGELDLGVASVTVPAIHAPGMIESASIWRLELRPDPSKHVALQSVTRLEDAAFYDRLSAEFDDDMTEALVFGQGYNVTFDQAAKRAAQMAYDMHYPAVPILYS